MLWDLINLFLGGLPDDYSFLKIYGVLFILYIVAAIFKMFLDVIKSLLRWY